MEDNDYVLAFDHFYTTNHIQILKSLLPFIDNESSSMLPVIIKYMELKYTLSLIHTHKDSNPSNGIRASSTSTNPNGEPIENLENIYKAVHKYLAPSEEKSFSQLLSAIKTMKSVREMQQMMELFQSMNPDTDLGTAMENLSSGGMNLNGLNLNNLNLNNMNLNGMDLNELMNLFGGTGNGDKQ